MTTLTRIEGFPKGRLQAARHALELAHRRLVRAAERAGQAAPAAPELVVVAEGWTSRCSACKVTENGVAGGACLSCREGVMVARATLDLELRAERPALAGWEFLAVIEPLQGGNLIRKVPGADVEDGGLECYRTSTSRCDHCETNRRRTETFVVRADGSDPAIAAGTVRQVGRNCLESFLGGKSPAAIVASLGWDILVREAGDEGGEGGWGAGETALEPVEFLAWVASSARIAGFVTRGAARDNADKQSTADHAVYLMTPPWSVAHHVHWAAARATFKPTDADRARGGAALAWARALPGASDYERNLRLVAEQPALERRHAGILASAVQVHARAIGDEIARQARGAGEHVGAVGDKLDLELTVEKDIVSETQWGLMHMLTMRDAEGRAFLWRTGVAGGAAGDCVKLRGTVKAHSEYKGEKQTELTRCRISERRPA